MNPYSLSFIALLILGLVVVNIVDAWKRVEWIEWWASTRTPEGGRESGAETVDSRLPSGARRVPRNSPSPAPGSRTSRGQ